LLADEVQTLPAENYKNILNYKFRVKIGLTATPYRGDNNINLIFQLIGPKLYEEELKKLIDLGYLARPYCVEVRCEFSELFKEAYRRCQQGCKSFFL
jgi:DNA excision repair protein ERCC-3